MAQEFGLLARLRDAGAVLVQGRLRLPHGSRRVGDRLCGCLQAAECVEDRPVGHRIDERPVVVLPVDLDERRADRPQNLDADRLVVDEGAGAAVRDLDAAENQVALGVDIRIGRNPAGRVLEAAVEDGGYLALALAVAHEAAVAAPAEREREGIEQNGLAGTGLTREDAEALTKMKLELVDQDDIADRQLDQHARLKAHPVLWPTRGTPRKALLIQDSEFS